MSKSRQYSAETVQNDRLEGAVRGMVATAETPPSTEEISEALAQSVESVRECLQELAADGTLVERGDDDTTRWAKATADVRIQGEANSYRVKDPETGIVSRGGTRPEALHRLADRIEQHRAGETAGARIVGISESELSPAYARSVEELASQYVEPDDKHLYAYVASEGVRELERPSHLHRDYEVVGFAVTGQFTRSEFAGAIQPPVEELLARTRIEESQFPLSVYKVMAVHPDHQDRGIGTALATHGMAYLAEKPPVVAMLWERENDGNVRLAEDYGAERLAEFENTSPSTWQCPECGFGTTCTCTSVLYGWGFGSDGE